MPIPKRNPGENKDDFITRCMSDEKMKSEYTDESQRYAVCVIQLESYIISFDYDGTLSTKKGKELAKKFISEGKDVRILTAREISGDNRDLNSTADELGIEDIYYTNGRDKWSFVLKYKIKEHYDNNQEQVDKINEKTIAKGILFKD